MSILLHSIFDEIKPRGNLMNETKSIITEDSSVKLKLPVLISLIIFIVLQSITITTYVVMSNYRNDTQDTELNRKVDLINYRRDRYIDSIGIIQIKIQSERNGEVLEKISRKLGVENLHD